MAIFQSISRPWINFETGCAWIKKLPVIPICHLGMTKSALPTPLSSFQALDLDSSSFVQDFLESIAKHFNIPKLPRIDKSAMQSELLKSLNSIKHQTSKSKTSGEPTPAPTVDDNEQMILRLLAKPEIKEPTSGEIARLLRLHPTVCEYNLDTLLAKELIGHILIIGTGARYYLLPLGRKYVVEHNLL